VTFLCDTGERYLSKQFNDEWMRENQMLETDRATLGALISQKDVSAPTLISAQPGQSVRQALRLMTMHDISQLPVMDGQNCVGSISEWSLTGRSLENPKMLDATVSEVMDSPYPVVEGSQVVDAVVTLLSKTNPAVLVREHGNIAGIVTRSDVLHYLMSR
jgi:cystathionine beta-synthase